MSILNMDCIEGMKAFPDNSFDSIVCDPPYELGFMGKAWDSTGIANNVAMWREALRVLKPGGHLLAFSGSRTYHRMTCAIEDAGFEVRDQIMWIYGSGFPKSHNLEGVNSGWGTALKPAHEPICVARKPLIGTVAANVLAFGTGAINIDGCRISGEPVRKNTAGGLGFGTGNEIESGTGTLMADVGRWPANLIHDGSDEVVSAFPEVARSKRAPIADDQTYVPNNKNAVFGSGMGSPTHAGFADTEDTAARFFYCAKASKSDRDEGLAGFTATVYAGSGALRDGSRETEARRNIHPTVKPTALMRYLVRLVTPPGGTVLDPFAGSGSTGKAAKLEGFGFIGFELNAEYAAIANARYEAAA